MAEAAEQHQTSTDQTSTAEELENEKELLRRNLERVKFTPARVKFIVWNHKSSYDIPEEEPTAALTEAEVEKALGLFHGVAITVSVPLPADHAQQETKQSNPVVEGDEKENGPTTHEIQVVQRLQICDLLLQYGGLLTKHVAETQKPLVEATIDKFLARSLPSPQHHTKHASAVITVTADQHDPDNAHIEEHHFLSFLEKYRAPGYHFGQRMRRFAGRGEVDAVAELIIRGCSVNTADGEALSSLHYASEFNRVHVIEKIAELCPPHDSDEGHEKSHEKLLLNCHDKYGWTPLHFAAHHGNVDCVNVLLKLGADVMSKDVVGKTPLHAAAARGKHYIVDPLLAARGAINDQVLGAGVQGL